MAEYDSAFRLAFLIYGGGLFLAGAAVVGLLVWIF